MPSKGWNTGGPARGGQRATYTDRIPVPTGGREGLGLADELRFLGQMKAVAEQQGVELADVLRAAAPDATAEQIEAWLEIARGVRARPDLL